MGDVRGYGVQGGRCTAIKNGCPEYSEGPVNAEKTLCHWAAFPSFGFLK